MCPWKWLWFKSPPSNMKMAWHICNVPMEKVIESQINIWIAHLQSLCTCPLCLRSEHHHPECSISWSSGQVKVSTSRLYIHLNSYQPFQSHKCTYIHPINPPTHLPTSFGRFMMTSTSPILKPTLLGWTTQHTHSRHSASPNNFPGAIWNTQR